MYERLGARATSLALHRPSHACSHPRPTLPGQLLAAVWQPYGSRMAASWQPYGSPVDRLAVRKSSSPAAFPRKAAARRGGANRESRASRRALCVGGAGTLSYMAPELLAEKKRAYDSSVDMWAMGVVTYMLLSGRLPVPVASF